MPSSDDAGQVSEETGIRAVAVIGLGRFGESVALALAQHKCRVLGIDRDEVVVQRLSPQFPCVVLDATDEKALREADIDAFDVVVVAIAGDFESNVLTTAAVNDVGVGEIICLAATPYEREILLQVGANRSIEPDVDAGRRLARELVGSETEGQFPVGPGQVVGKIAITEGMGGRRLAGLDLPRREVQVLALQRGAISLVQPPADTQLLAGDLLVVLGPGDVVARLGQRRGMDTLADS